MNETIRVKKHLDAFWLYMQTFSMEQSSALFGSVGPEHYQIRVKGRLARRWQHWFDGLRLSIDHDTTMLSGTLADQAALYGVLLKIRDLGVPLLSVQHLPLEETISTPSE